jgi:hypothetical protein
MIFDNLVIDMGHYDHAHPGGKFFLLKNIGRDISKFFFGGYSMVQARQPYTHSVNSIAIIKEMIVGVLAGQTEVADKPYTIVEKMSVNELTTTFTFGHAGGETVPNLKRWYSDLSMIGRHFLIYSKAIPNVKRQYTICSAMRPDLHEQLIGAIKSVTSPEGDFEFNKASLNDVDQDKICLTLKNYKAKRGMATQLHDSVINSET